MTALQSHIQAQARANRKPGEKPSETQVRIETEVMNRLQGEGGIISDLCAWAEDVPATDARKAVEWLKKQDKLEKGELNL